MSLSVNSKFYGWIFKWRIKSILLNNDKELETKTAIRFINGTLQLLFLPNEVDTSKNLYDGASYVVKAAKN